MKLGFHYHIFAMMASGKVKMHGYLWLFDDGLTAFYEQVVCLLHTHLADEVYLKGSEALTQSVEIVLTNPKLRQDFIRKGLTQAKNNTLEKHASELISNIAYWLDTGSTQSTGASPFVEEDQR